jgi:hypothetical protein
VDGADSDPDEPDQEQVADDAANRPALNPDVRHHQAEPSRRAIMDLTFTVIIRCEERF